VATMVGAYVPFSVVTTSTKIAVSMVAPSLCASGSVKKK